MNAELTVARQHRISRAAHRAQRLPGRPETPIKGGGSAAAGPGPGECVALVRAGRLLHTGNREAGMERTSDLADATDAERAGKYLSWPADLAP